MNIELLSSNLPDKINIPSSKSYANRALILGAMGEIKKIEQLPDGQDTVLLIKAFEDLKLKFSLKNNSIEFFETFFEYEKRKNNHEMIELYAGEGGTTARFLVSLLSRGNHPYTVTLNEQLAIRPWDELINALTSLGVEIKKNNHKIMIQGPWKKIETEVNIDASKTSQFYSSILLVAPKDMKLTCFHLTAAKSYIELTHYMKNLKQPHFKVPKDWSSAAPLLILAVLKKQSCHFLDLNLDPLQGDSLLGNILLQKKGLTQTLNGCMTNELSDYSPLQLDLSSAQDLFPSLVVFCSFLNGKSHLSGLKNLKFKESNRFEEALKTLDLFKIEYEKTEDSISIFGKPERELLSIKVAPPKDHRMVMMTALFMALGEGGEISEAEAVNKSFPTFWDYFKCKKRY
jgi:3-phosphoshikimate 1-carboxyvinyltransferase